MLLALIIPKPFGNKGTVLDLRANGPFFDNRTLSRLSTLFIVATCVSRGAENLMMNHFFEMFSLESMEKPETCVL